MKLGKTQLPASTALPRRQQKTKNNKIFSRWWEEMMTESRSETSPKNADKKTVTRQRSFRKIPENSTANKKQNKKETNKKRALVGWRPRTTLGSSLDEGPWKRRGRTRRKRKNTKQKTHEEKKNARQTIIPLFFFLSLSLQLRWLAKKQPKMFGKKTRFPRAITDEKNDVSQPFRPCFGPQRFVFDKQKQNKKRKKKTEFSPKISRFFRFWATSPSSFSSSDGSQVRLG